MNILFTMLPLALKVAGAWFDYKITGKITESEYLKAKEAFAKARFKGNKSADARVSIENQFQQLEKEKANGSQETPKAPTDL